MKDFGDYFAIIYDTNHEYIHFDIQSPISDTEYRKNAIVLEDGTDEYFYISGEHSQSGEITHSIIGSIKASIYKFNAPIPYDIYEGPEIHKSHFSEMSRLMIEGNVTCFNNFLKLYVPELDISNFGFTCFE